MKISKTFVINRDYETVWRTLVEEFGSVDQWASLVEHSTSQDKEVIVGTGRKCTTKTFGKLTEKVTKVDKANGHFCFDAQSDKMPFFVRAMHNRWSLKMVDSRTTELTTEVNVDMMMPFNYIMHIPLKAQMSKTLDGLIHDLKTYTEQL